MNGDPRDVHDAADALLLSRISIAVCREVVAPVRTLDSSERVKAADIVGEWKTGGRMLVGVLVLSDVIHEEWFVGWCRRLRGG